MIDLIHYARYFTKFYTRPVIAYLMSDTDKAGYSNRYAGMLETPTITIYYTRWGMLYQSTSDIKQCTINHTHPMDYVVHYGDGLQVTPSYVPRLTRRVYPWRSH